MGCMSCKLLFEATTVRTFAEGECLVVSDVSSRARRHSKSADCFTDF